MTLYIIFLDAPSDHAWQTIKDKWPTGHYIRNDRLAFISTDELTTGDISSTIGIGAESGISGIVIQMDYYAGRTDSALVEWIGKNS